LELAADECTLSAVSALARSQSRPISDHVGIVVDGKYDICQRMAAGGVGTVYRARHRYTGRQVALKLLHEQFSRDRSMSERFLREAKAAAEIGHPNIVDVVDAGVDEQVGVYVAFELLEGFDLAEALKARKLSIRQVLDVADAVLDALHAAHQAGVIHRDIKPPNIFLLPGEGGALHVRVLDFGAAKRQQVSVEESLTTLGTVIGTPAYMSPEQASGHPVDPRTDVWSVGAVLFRAFAERPPFTEKNPNLLLACIIRDTAPSLAELRPDLDPALIAVVDKALTRDLALRFQSAAEMREALRQARLHASERPAADPLATVPMARPADLADTMLEKVPASSRRIRALSLGALMALGAGVALAFALTRSPDSTAASVASVSAPVPLPSANAAPAATPSQAKPAAAASEASSVSTPVSAPTAPPAAAASQKPPKAAPTATQRPPVAPIREYE